MTRTSFITFLLGVVLTAALFVAGCKSDNWRDQRPPDFIYEVDPNAGPGVGSLQVYVFGAQANRYKPEQGVYISVYRSLEDHDRDVALRRLYTDNYGYADFGPLNFGDYYLSCVKRVNNSDVARLETAQVQVGQRLTRNVVLY